MTYLHLHLLLLLGTLLLIGRKHAILLLHLHVLLLLPRHALHPCMLTYVCSHLIQGSNSPKVSHSELPEERIGSRTAHSPLHPFYTAGMPAMRQLDLTGAPYPHACQVGPSAVA